MCPPLSTAPALVQRVTRSLKGSHTLSRVACTCLWDNPIYLGKIQSKRAGKWSPQAGAGAACLDEVSSLLLSSLTGNTADGPLPEFRKGPKPCSATVSLRLTPRQEELTLTTNGLAFVGLITSISLEKEMATCSSILTWEIPWTEEPGRLHSMGMQSVGCNRATEHSALEASSFPGFDLDLTPVKPHPHPGGEGRVRVQEMPAGQHLCPSSQHP